MARERMHFNPITKSVGPWIDLGALHRVYGRNLPFPQDIPTGSVPPKLTAAATPVATTTVAAAAATKSTTYAKSNALTATATTSRSHQSAP